MSGRGTIKAGTYGGRRYREKVVKKTTQAKELAKEVKASQRVNAPSSKQIRSMPKPAGIDDLRAQQRVLNAPLGRGGTANPQGETDVSRNRSIQQAVNTMPLVQNQRYLALLREQVEQRHRETLNPDVEFEDYNDQDFSEDLAVERQRFNEDGEQEYGTANPAPDNYDGNFGEIDDLGFDPFTDTMEDDLELIDVGTDSDEEAEAFGRDLDKVGEKKDLSAEIQKRRDARMAKSGQTRVSGGGAITLPQGDRVPTDFRIRGTDPRILKAQADQRKDIGSVEQASMLPKNRATSGADTPRNVMSNPQARDVSSGMYIKALTPGFKHPTQYPIESYKRKKQTKKEGGGTKLDIGAKGNLKPTEQALALSEGRSMDTRLGFQGRDIETGTRSRVKEADMMAQAGYVKKTAKRVTDLGMGVKRDPKTRKILTKANGDPIMEKKKLTIAPREKKVEELWGLDRKGMSREGDNPATRDPYEGRRAIAKEPGKRATKAREAETKHALYIKSKIAEDPDYLPAGFNPFGYGSGSSVFDKKGNKGATLISGGGGARQYIPDAVASVRDFEGDSSVSDNQIQSMNDMKQPVNNLRPAFPGATDILAPRRSLNIMGISQPPMANMQATAGTQQPITLGRFDGRVYDNQGQMITTSSSEIANMSDAQLMSVFG